MVDSIVGNALKGIQQGMQSAAKNAEKISQAFNPQNPEESSDALEPMIGLKLDEQQVKASAKVIETSKKMDDAVLDILA